MRPYWAVIVDSFRAAFSSRVLWIALAAIYVFLIAIAPIGYREVYTTQFRWMDFSNGTRMKAMLAQDIDRDETTPIRLLARTLPEELQSNLRKVAAGQEVRIRLDLFAAAFNELLDKDDWYDAEVWKKTVRLREQRELEEKPASALSNDARQRLARLRIEAALPGVMEHRGTRSIALTYAGYDFPAEFRLEPDQFKLVLNHFVIRVVIDWLLGFVMIFLGILVTAAIIPDMLQPGSLHLLLSKPVSRQFLFLAKFIGGCAFVFLCVSQLIVGLWLICGWRLEIWNARLLYCIPICVFLFAVFFSVSALAGLRWRSPILAIGVANAFGALCLIVGLAGGIADGFVRQRDRIDALVIAGETIVATTDGAKLRRFDRQLGEWIDLIDEKNSRGDRLLPPVLMPQGLIVSARVRGGQMSMFGSGATTLWVLDPKADWKPRATLDLPASTTQLLTTPQGELIALNSGELMIADPTALQASLAEHSDATAEESQEPRADQAVSGWLPLLKKMMGSATDGFRPLVGKENTVTAPRSLCFAADGKTLFVHSSGSLMRFERSTQSDPTAVWSLSKKMDLEVGNRRLFVQPWEQGVIVFQSDTMPVVYSSDLVAITATAPDSVLADVKNLRIDEVFSCGDRDLALLTVEGQLYHLQSLPNGAAKLSSIGTFGDIDSAHWQASDNQLWFSYQVDSLAAYDIATGKIVQRYRPQVHGWRAVDRYVVTPLRTVTPQTGELSETIASLVSGQSALDLSMMPEQDKPERYNFWRPVLTCGAFIIVMLTISCVYFSRLDC